MNKDNIKLIGIEQTDIGEIEYKDDDVAIYTDIRELPVEEEPIRLDMYAIAACAKGKIQIDLNAEKFLICQGEVLICKPNDVITNFMASPDFYGAVMFLSQRFLMEQISESTIWNNAFRIMKNPVIKVCEASMGLYMQYDEILQAKMKQEQMPFRREIITAIIKAALYELLSNSMLEAREIPGHKLRLDKASDVLFKRFIELISSCRIKPRTVAWYAESLCVTPKYLSTTCKQVTGKTAFYWINKHVTIDIRYWLKNSDKTIKEVADLLEFPNISFFGKYCRTHFGVSPTVLRKQLQEQRDEEQSPDSK